MACGAWGACKYIWLAELGGQVELMKRYNYHLQALAPSRERDRSGAIGVDLDVWI